MSGVMGSRVGGCGFGVGGLRVQGSGFRGWGSGFWGLGWRLQGLGWKFGSNIGRFSGPPQADRLVDVLYRGLIQGYNPEP